MALDYSELLVRDPQICGGEPVVRGTRVPVRTILASLAEGTWIDEILADFPTLRVEQVRAVIEDFTDRRISPYNKDEIR